MSTRRPRRQAGLTAGDGRRMTVAAATLATSLPAAGRKSCLSRALQDAVRRLVIAACLLLLAPAGAEAKVQVTVSATEVALANGQMERRWTRAGLTSTLVDKRGGGRTWSARRRDFALDLVSGVSIGSERFTVTGVRTTPLARGGQRVTMELASPVPGLTATRIAEAWPGIAGVRTQTILHPAAGLALSGASLDEAAVGAAAPELHAFRAGADWREPEWEGPPLTIGDPHPGSWRDTRTAGEGQALRGPGQWLTAAARRALAVPRDGGNDFPSSRAAYDGAVAALRTRRGRATS